MARGRNAVADEVDEFSENAENAENAENDSDEGKPDESPEEKAERTRKTLNRRLKVVYKGLRSCAKVGSGVSYDRLSEAEQDKVREFLYGEVEHILSMLRSRPEKPQDALPDVI